MKWLILFVLFFLLVFDLKAQLSYSGNVVDALDKKYLEGVMVRLSQGSGTSVTNSRGYFSLKASAGDTLIFSYLGFLEMRVPAGEERFLFIELEDKARLLPTFEVKADAYAFRFKDGKLITIDPNAEEERVSTKGRVMAGPTGSPTGGFGIYGPISYFSKSARNAREYAKKQAWHARREGYYAVVDSDSVRQNLMVRHQLERSEWDQLIILYNERNLTHEFLDWSQERVYSNLDQFIDKEKNWIR